MAEKVEEFLAHYGVLGMKWGKRKPRSASSQDHVTSRETKKKRLDEMSNAELKQLVTRMNLEKQYADLANKAPKSETRKFVENLAKQQVTSLVAKNAPLIIDKALKAYASH